MAPGAREACSERRGFIEDVMGYFRDRVSREDLRLLLTEAEAWEKFVAEAGLSRDEAEALREALIELTAEAASEDKDALQQDLVDRERFLKEFPQVKTDLEERIGKLRALADKMDKVHRDCTISNVVATSTGAVSGVLTILGLALAPVTAGASLILSATGMGLGTAAAVTGVSTSIAEHSIQSLTKAEASKLVSTSVDKVAVVTQAVGQSAPKAISLTKNCIQVLQDLGKHIRAIKLAKANTRLLASSRRLMTTGSISVRRGKQVQKAFGGTALAMTKEARILGAATAGVFLLMDVVSLVKESMHLHEGARAESAEELRQCARGLERKLGELIQIHERLQSVPTSDPSPEQSSDPSPSPEQSSDPSLSPEQGSDPSPSPEQGSDPSLSPEQGSDPSPSPEQGRDPSPSPGQGRDPSPSPEQGSDPSPSPEQGRDPSPSPEQGRDPSPSPEQGRDPSLEQGSDPSPSPEQGRDPSLEQGSDPSPSPEQGSNSTHSLE